MKYLMLVAALRATPAMAASATPTPPAPDATIQPTLTVFQAEVIKRALRIVGSTCGSVPGGVQDSCVILQNELAIDAKLAPPREAVK
jgi:hypothetical protein